MKPRLPLKKCVMIIEQQGEALRVSAFEPKDIRRIFIDLASEGKEAAAAKLKEFCGAHSCKRLIVLAPRSTCLMGTFSLPSRKPAELLNMAEFKFARSTPHQKKDIVVDVRALEAQARSHTLVAGAMMVKERLTPMLEVIARAGLTPDIVTVSTERLLPLARAVWGAQLNGTGKVLGLCLNGSLSLGFFSRGEMLFSREEAHGTDSSIGAFIEYCHKEFPSVTIKEGLLLGGVDEAGIPRSIAGVDLGVEALSSLVRTVQQQAAFEEGPEVFLDLLLVNDSQGKAFDFSTDEIRQSRRRLEWKKIAIHIGMMFMLILIGLGLLAGSQVYRRGLENAAVERVISQEAERVRELERKARAMAVLENSLARRVPVSKVMLSLSSLLPVGGRINSLDFKEGGLNITGEADDLNTARGFYDALSGDPFFKDVRLDGIDKRPAEASQVVTFRMTMRVIHD